MNIVRYRERKSQYFIYKELPNVDYFGFNAKVYNDGSHFLCTPIKNKTFSSKKKLRIDPRINQEFDNIYKDIISKGIKGKAVKEILKTEIVSKHKDNFVDYTFLESYVDNRLKLKKNNLYNRLKRLKRKATMNDWNYFATFTYDNKKMDSETFRESLKKTLANFSTRRKWRYLGVFELSPKTDRLHFHCLLYVPDNQMPGTLREQRDFSLREHKMQSIYVNTFFLKKFGRNDFKPLNKQELQQSNVINYLTKYLSKQDEKILYSRHTPGEISLYIDKRDIVTEFYDFCLKYVLFDDVINDKLEYQKYLWKTKQLSIDDFL